MRNEVFGYGKDRLGLNVPGEAESLEFRNWV